ncbi:MAG TPA: hypothetical protein VGK63_07740 [Candidatus Limnocylindrales bacterium]
MTDADEVAGAAAESRARSIVHDRPLLLSLLGLAVVAFLARLLPVVLTGGLRGYIDYDDGVYMGTALALLRGTIVYRDFYMLHPPGIVYVLSPFAALSFVVSDAAAFMAARVGFMLLGAVNTVLVGLLASRLGRWSALASAALYAVWIVPIYTERSTWLVGPQNTLLLLALLAMARRSRGSDGTPAPLGWRRAALVGALIGACGAIQIWGAVTAAAVFVWLVVEVSRQRDRLRPLIAYVVAGIAALVLLLLPFFLAAGTKMIRIIIFDQLGRGGDRIPIGARLRAIEGLPASSHVPDAIVGAVFVAAVMVVVIGAWRRPAIRPWAWILAAQLAFLFVTPSFFRHYSAWLAATATVAIGSSVATIAGWVAGRRGAGEVPLRPASGVIGGGYAIALAGLLAISTIPGTAGFHRPSDPFPSRQVARALATARCPTADSATMLILTGLLRRMLDNGCPVLVSPTGVSYDSDPTLRGPGRSRKNQVEYQAIMARYYGESDGAAFIRKESSNGLTDQTWATIRSHLPVELRIGNKITIYLPAGS